jgi:hypothetical protein
MDDDDARRKPSRRQALVTAGLAAVAVPLFGRRHPPTPQPAPVGTPSAEPPPVQSGASPVSAPPYIVGISPDGTYFIDQNGNPRLMLVDNPWALIFNAGEWSSGDWQSEMGRYLELRSEQDFTGLYLSALGNLDNGGSYLNGNTWDNVPPFTGGGNPSAGLNDTYWQRVDYLISTAESLGLTVFLNIAYTSSGGPGNFDSGAALDYTVLTQTEYDDYGTAVANRYASSPNLVWMYGNDYYGGYLDTQFGYIRDAIVATGDTHAMGVHVYPESTSRYDIETATDSSNGTAFGYDYSQINWVYSYNVTYFGVERAFEEAAAHNISMLPAVWGDGLFWGGQDQPMRQMAWWALSSGARGCNTGDNNVWAWDSGSAAAVVDDGIWADWQVRVARSLIESLPGWYTLLPDTSSALVTAGRGTHASGISTGNSYTFGTDNYVTASRTPDTGQGSTLAVIYGSEAYSITINEAKMVPGYTATWVDPANGAKMAATPGATYSSGSLGNNSAGDPDWVLVLQAPPQ